MLKRRTILKKSPSTLKRASPIKRKPKTVEQLQEQSEQHEKDWAFYSKIWSEREHVCQSCDKRLYGELKNYYMDHLLEKSTYPQFRYVESNIAIVCEDPCHSRKTNGFPTERHQVLIEQAKQLLLNNEKL